MGKKVSYKNLQNCSEEINVINGAVFVIFWIKRLSKARYFKIMDFSTSEIFMWDVK